MINGWETEEEEKKHEKPFSKPTKFVLFLDFSLIFAVFVKWNIG